MIPTTDELQKELETLVKEVPAFAESGFSFFDMDDAAAKTALQSFPLVGVMYDGAIPIERQGGNSAVGVASGSQSTSMLSKQFTVVIVIQYHYGGQDDTKPQATDLLDDVRKRVLGYKGANARPWRFIGEKPEPEASGEGLAFYSQVWQTTVAVTGNFNNS